MQWNLGSLGSKAGIKQVLLSGSDGLDWRLYIYVQSGKWALLAQTASPVLSRSANLQTKKIRSYLQTKKIRSFPCHYSFKGDLSRVIRASLFICVPEIAWYPWHPSWAGFDPWDEESQPCYLRSSSHKKNLNFTGLWYSGFRKKKKI